MKTMKRALTLIMAVMMVAAMAPCGNKPAASNGDETTGDGSLKRVQDAGKLIVDCETSWPPFAYIDDKQQLVGYDVEVAEEIAKRLGVDFAYPSSNSWTSSCLRRRWTSAVTPGRHFSRSSCPRSARPSCRASLSV